MLSPLSTKLADEFWSTLLGCDVSHLYSPGIVLVPSPQPDDNEELVNLMRRSQGCVVSVVSKQPAELVDMIEGIAGTRDANEFFDSLDLEGWNRSGASAVCLADASGFRRRDESGARLMKGRDDAILLRRFMKEFSLPVWEQGGVDFDDPVVVGAFDGADLVSLVSIGPWTDEIACVNLISKAGYGLGGHAVAAMSLGVGEWLRGGPKRIVVSKVLMDVEGSAEVVDALGFAGYALTRSFWRQAVS